MKVGESFEVKRGFKLRRHGEKTHINRGAVGVITAVHDGHIEIEVGKRAKHAGKLSIENFRLIVSDEPWWGSENCKFCGGEFRKISKHQVYCSDACRRLLSKARSAERNYSPTLITHYLPAEWQDVQRLAACKPWV